MKRTHLMNIVIIAAVLCALPAPAFAFLGIDVGIGYWQQEPSGTLTYKPTSAITGDVNLKDDLYFDKTSKANFRARAELPLILPNLYFMATPMSFEGSGTLTRTISFANTSFTANTPITTKLTLDHYDLALFYPIPLLKTATLGILNVDLGLNVRKIDFQGSITDATQTAKKDFALYLPMIFGAVQIKPVSSFALDLEVRGTSLAGGRYLDYIGRLKIMPIPLLYIGGGYRSETIKFDSNDVKTDMKFAGPFAEVGVSF